MPEKKILSQSGISLADAYEVTGSNVGAQFLDADTIKTVHEMGSTLSSERMSSSIGRRSTGALAQNISWDITIDDLPTTPTRISNLAVVMTTNRLLTCSVAVQCPREGREVPIFVWDTSIDDKPIIRFVDNGGAVGGVYYLRPKTPMLVPGMLLGTDQRLSVPNLVFRGSTSGFGAGTVTATLVFQHTFIGSGVTGAKTFGLPIPSW
jgi:hypothetical protein